MSSRSDCSLYKRNDTRVHRYSSDDNDDCTPSWLYVISRELTKPVAPSTWMSKRVCFSSGVRLILSINPATVVDMTEAKMT
jgi:hypothetical protein